MHSANNSIVINEKTHTKDANADLGYQNLVHINFFSLIELTQRSMKPYFNGFPIKPTITSSLLLFLRQSFPCLFVFFKPNLHS